MKSRRKKLPVPPAAASSPKKAKPSDARRVNVTLRGEGGEVVGHLDLSTDQWAQFRTEARKRRLTVSRFFNQLVLEYFASSPRKRGQKVACFESMLETLEMLNSKPAMKAIRDYKSGKTSFGTLDEIE